MWYSHKFNGPGLRYEVAISIQGGDIVWINGPFPCGSWPDIKIFRERLMHALPQGEKAEADMGYRGEPTKIDLPEENIFGSNIQREAKALVRSRHETCNRRFKQWNSLSLVFRHNLKKHKTVFDSVAVLTQISIDYGNKLFSVDYKTKPMRNATSYNIKYSELIKKANKH